MMMNDVMQAMAYLNVAAVGAAAQSAAFAKLGQTELQWMKICDMYGKFCNQIGEGIAVALLVSISLVVLSCISAFSLFRLYGGSKAKNNSGWWQNLGTLITTFQLYIFIYIHSFVSLPLPAQAHSQGLCSFMISVAYYNI